MITTTNDLATIPNHVLQTDCLGRIRFPESLRNELLDRFEKSGMSGAQFAEFYHIKYTTFASWRQKRDRQRRKAAGELESSGFIELALPADPPETGRLELQLPGGASLRISNREDARLAAELLKALGESGC